MCFFGTVILKDSPLNAVQLLWVNLVMDTLGALALATEPPSVNILERQPYKKDNAIVTEQMWRNVFGHAAWQIILLSFILLGGQGLFCENYITRCFEFSKTNAYHCVKYNPYFTNELYLMNDEINGWKKLNLKKDNFEETAINAFICQHIRETKKDMKHVCTPAELKDPKNTFLPQDQTIYTETQKVRHFTFVFNIFVFLQIFNIINSRKIEGELNVFSSFFNNCLFLFVIILTIGVQIFIIEYGSMATKTVAFNMNENLVCIGIGASSLIIGLIIKFLPLKFFQCVNLDDAPLDEEDAKKSLIKKFKSTKGVDTSKIQKTQNVEKFEEKFKQNVLS